MLTSQFIHRAMSEGNAFRVDQKPEVGEGCDSSE